MDFIELTTGSFFESTRYKIMVARKYVISISKADVPTEGFDDLTAHVSYDAPGQEPDSGIGYLLVSHPSYEELKAWLEEGK